MENILITQKSVRREPGLYTQGVNLTVAGGAGTVSTLNFDVPTDRGDIIGISFVADHQTVADLVGSTFTISGNGTQVFQDAPVILFAPLVANFGQNNIAPVKVNNGGTIVLSVTNQSANPYESHLILYYKSLDANC